MLETPSALATRIPPQNLEAEQAALGAMLLERDAIARALDLVRPDDFYRETHRLICRGIYALYDRNEPVDLVTLGEWLRAHEALEQCGGTLYLQQLLVATPTAAAVERYARIVRETARRRALIRLADHLLEDGYREEEDSKDLIARYQRMLDAIELNASDVESLQLWEWEQQVLQEMREADARGQDIGIRTNLRALNHIMDPMLPGDMIVVAGRPSMGKSVLAMQFAVGACESGHRALFISGEMSAASLAGRALTAASSVPAWKTKLSHYRRAHGDAIYPSLEEAIDRHRSYDLEVVRPRVFSPQEVLSLGRRKRHTTGLDLVVVDYLQLMTTGTASSDRYDRISTISRELKDVASSLKVPVVVVSQLSREVEHRTPRRPLMSDLRDSGQIEQDADAILLLYRPGYYDGDNWAENRRVNLPPEDRGTTEIIIAKQRNGKTGTVQAYFDLERSRFHDLDDVRKE